MAAPKAISHANLPLRSPANNDAPYRLNHASCVFTGVLIDTFYLCTDAALQYRSPTLVKICEKFRGQSGKESVGASGRCLGLLKPVLVKSSDRHLAETSCNFARKKTPFNKVFSIIAVVIKIITLKIGREKYSTSLF